RSIVFEHAPAFAEIGQTCGRILRGEEFLGQRLETQHHARQALLPRQFARARDQCAMPQMNAIEATDCRHIATGGGAAGVEMAQQAHQTGAERRWRWRMPSSSSTAKYSSAASTMPP